MQRTMDKRPDMGSVSLLNYYENFFAANLIFCLLEVAMNALLIHAFRKMKKLTTPSFRLFTVLSTSDLLLAAFSILMDTLLIAIDGMSFEQLNIIRLTSIVTRFLFGEFSALMTVFIAVDRYIHLIHPFDYFSMLTPTRSIVITITLAFVSIAMIAAVMMAYVCDFFKEVLIILSVFNSFVLIATSCIYHRALKSIKHTASHASFKTSRSRYDKEFSRAVLFILASQILFYTPFILIKPISEYIKMQRRLVLTLTFVSQLLIYFQGIANVLIFIHFHKETRKFVKQLVFGHLAREVNPVTAQGRQTKG